MARVAEWLWAAPDRWGDVGWVLLRVWLRTTRTFPFKDQDGSYRLMRKVGG